MNNRFGSAPLGKMIFMDKEKEWEEMDPNVKNHVIRNLAEYAKKS